MHISRPKLLPRCLDKHSAETQLHPGMVFERVRFIERQDLRVFDSCMTYCLFLLAVLAALLSLQPPCLLSVTTRSTRSYWEKHWGGNGQLPPHVGPTPFSVLYDPLLSHFSSHFPKVERAIRRNVIGRDGGSSFLTESHVFLFHIIRYLRTSHLPRATTPLKNSCGKSSGEKQ